MSGYTAGRPSIKQIVAATLLLTLILVEVAANPAYSSGINTSSVGVSPGKYDLPLGNDFPTFGTVKLSYPDSAILTNSTGDLLFNVTLNPLMLNPTSAQILSSVLVLPVELPNPEVLVSGSGFSSKDTSCTLSGIPVASPSSCRISGGNLVPGTFGTFHMVQCRQCSRGLLHCYCNRPSGWRLLFSLIHRPSSVTYSESIFRPSRGDCDSFWGWILFN